MNMKLLIAVVAGAGLLALAGCASVPAAYDGTGGLPQQPIDAPPPPPPSETTPANEPPPPPPPPPTLTRALAVREPCRSPAGPGSGAERAGDERDRRAPVTE